MAPIPVTTEDLGLISNHMQPKPLPPAPHLGSRDRLQAQPPAGSGFGARKADLSAAGFSASCWPPGQCGPGTQVGPQGPSPGTGAGRSLQTALGSGKGPHPGAHLCRPSGLGGASGGRPREGEETHYQSSWRAAWQAGNGEGRREGESGALALWDEPGDLAAWAGAQEAD